MTRNGSFLYLSLVLYFHLFFSYFYLVNSQTLYYPKAKPSTTWINQPDDFINSSLSGLSKVLIRESTVSGFVCGFYCTRNVVCYFGVLIYQERPEKNFSSYVQLPQVVWSANRNNPVKANATLEFTSDGNLILADADGTRVWSTNTVGKSVAGLNLTDMGNLVLFDSKNRLVWQSFDHPTDSLVVGQKLRSGQRLVASASDSNSTEGIYSLAVENGTLVAYIQSNPPQIYYSSELYEGISSPLKPRDVKFENGSFDNYTFLPATTTQVMKFESDGRLRVYAWSDSNWERVDDDILLGYVDSCGYPMSCGRYGICSNKECSCPDTSNGESRVFRPVNSRQPDLGCSLATPIDCDYHQYHYLVKIENVTYFDSISNLYSVDIELERCQEACLRNCSCKAAIFVDGYPNNTIQSKVGNCSLLNEVFSLTAHEMRYGMSVFLKLQKSLIGSNALVNSPKGKPRHVVVILGSSLGALLGFLLIFAACFIVFVKFMKFEKIEEVYLDQVPGMPSRFTYEDLKAMTNNFSNKLGEGGCGSVFEGTQKNGDKIAVKRLDGLGLAKKSFLAEVETIGSIHHVNLVRLIGFCAEQSYRLLVYEYMCNGSLDKWIFCRNKENTLGWLLRKKIIFDVAKGLAYLHEECRQKIVHLDIKPQNILLDENFDAKVSDFGLSKLIDKDKSQVVTTLRGTLGYMAPEWLSSVITEKVDVYSFGVMVLEILCGRKNLDRSQPEEDAHLLGLFKKKAEIDQLRDLVDKNSEDMQLNGSQVVEMMNVAAWCLQSDFRKRPAISDVIRVLEGTMEVERNLDYDFISPPVPSLVVGKIEDNVVTSLLPSALSGPR